MTNECKFDDATECFCASCAADEDAFWRLQGDLDDGWPLADELDEMSIERMDMLLRGNA